MKPSAVLHSATAAPPYACRPPHCETWPRARRHDSVCSVPQPRAGITFSRCLTLLFVYHLLSYCYNTGAATGQVVWEPESATALNTVGSVVALFVVYDFFYTPFHLALHHPSVYWLVHKHHHRQKAPSRGNTDGINVHPFEFFTGE